MAGVLDIFITPDATSGSLTNELNGCAAHKGSARESCVKAVGCKTSYGKVSQLVVDLGEAHRLAAGSYVVNGGCAPLRRAPNLRARPAALLKAVRAYSPEAAHACRGSGRAKCSVACSFPQEDGRPDYSTGVSRANSLPGDLAATAHDSPRQATVRAIAR